MIIQRKNYMIECKRHQINFFSTESEIKVDKSLCDDFKESGDYAFKGWKPKVADSDASDYYSGYVRDFGREFGLHIEPSGKHIIFEDELPDHTLGLMPFRYRFNKSRFQTFIFDLLVTDEARKYIEGKMNEL